MILMLVAAPASQPAQRLLSLEDCIALSLKRSLQVQEADAQIDIQKAQADQALWAFWTPIEVIGMVGGPTPEAYGSGRFVRSEASLLGDLQFGKAGVFLGYSVRGAVPLFTFGKLTALRRAAKAGVRIAESNEERVRNETRANVARAYLGHSAARAFLELVDESDKTLSEALDNAGKMLQGDSDQVSENDVFMLRSLHGQLLARKAEAQQGSRTTKELIRFLIAAGESEEFELTTMELELPAEAPPKTATPFVSFATAHRAEVKMASDAINARRAAVSIHRGTLFPDLLLFGMLTQNYTSNQDYQKNPFLNNSTNELSGGVALGARWTLDFPTKLAKIREAEAEQTKAENQARLLESAIGLQVRKAYEELVAAYQMALEYQRAERSAKSWVVSTALNFNSGLGPAGDLFQAVRAFGEAGALRRKAVFDFGLAKVAMAEAMGADFGTVGELWRASGALPK